MDASLPVAEDRKVKVIYEKTARRVVAEARLSEDFSANIGLTQGVPLVLYYLLFSETDKQEDQPWGRLLSFSRRLYMQRIWQ